MSQPLTIALVAGEASGDQLGGKLIEALRVHYPDARYCGVGGRHMREAGFETWWDRDELSVMGLFEVARHLPRLLKLRRALTERLLEAKPDVLIGIDAPDFNLGLERRVRTSGITTVHYVSPTVWAWRPGRVRKIAEAADLVLCLFPFEPAFYAGHGVRARYAGHPMADAIDNDPDRTRAREGLGLPTDNESPLVALLPGSRASEVTRLAEPMLEAAALLAQRPGGARFVAGLADARTEALFRDARAAVPGLDCHHVTGRTLEVMASADVVVCASGTVALECLLVNRPMVVTYRLAAATHWMASTLGLVKTRFISLPNLLADEALVPELIQQDANGPAIADAVGDWLDDARRCEHVRRRFAAIHDELRRDAAASAASEIQALLASRDV